MCNLYSHTKSVDAVRKLFEVPASRDHLGNLPPLPAIYPRYEAPVVRLDSAGHNELVRMHWGFLLPQVSKKTGKAILPKAVNNARDDKLQHSPFWRGSFEERRCLIPATAYCEAEGRGPATYHWFGVRGDSEPLFAFAGLWRTFQGWYRDETVNIDTYTMVTTTPNELVATIHPQRMPAILDESAYGCWLTGTPEEAFSLIAPYPADQMEFIKPPSQIDEG